MVDLGGIGEQFAALPSLVQVALGYTLRPMLGDLRAIPAFLGRRATRGVEAETLARLEAAKEVGKLTAARAMAEPDYAAAAQQILLPSEIARARNRLGVAAAAIRDAAENEPSGAASQDTPRAPDDDWIAAFMRHAEDASSDQLQNLFGRILAGEIRRPNSFSRAALRAVAELDKELAEDFVWFWQQSIGTAVPTYVVGGPGESWARLQRLRDAGLVSPVDSAIWQPDQDAGAGSVGWTIGFPEISLVVRRNSAARIFVNVYNLTRIGMQVSTLIDPPDKEANLRRLARTFEDDGTDTLHLIQSGRLVRLWVRQGFQPIPPW